MIRSFSIKTLKPRQNRKKRRSRVSFSVKSQEEKFVKSQRNKTEVQNLS